MDAGLVRRAGRGDRDAFERLVSTRLPMLFSTAQRILRDIDAAEDATQEALVEAWTDLPRLRDPERFDPWLRRILVHACYDECRRRRRCQQRATALAAEAVTAQECPCLDEVAGVIERDEMEVAFRRLPVDQRAVLVLQHYLGLRPAEIAQTLGIPAPTVRSRLHYAHQALRAAVEAEARLVPAGAAAR